MAYGHLFSEEILDGFSDELKSDPLYAPKDTDEDRDYIAARTLVPHGATILGSRRSNCVSHRGERFKRLIILYDLLAQVNEKSRKVRCLCVCGKEKSIDYDSLKAGYVVSCGCYRQERQDPKMKAQRRAESRTRQVKHMESTDPSVGEVCKSLVCIGPAKMCGRYRFVPCACSLCGKKTWYAKNGFLFRSASCLCSCICPKKNKTKKADGYGYNELRPNAFGLTSEDVACFLSLNTAEIL